MVDQNAVDLVKEALTRGKTESELVALLRQSGYNDGAISEIMAAAKPSVGLEGFRVGQAQPPMRPAAASAGGSKKMLIGIVVVILVAATGATAYFMGWVSFNGQSAGETGSTGQEGTQETPPEMADCGTMLSALEILFGYDRMSPAGKCYLVSITNCTASKTIVPSPYYTLDVEVLGMRDGMCVADESILSVNTSDSFVQQVFPSLSVGDSMTCKFPKGKILWGTGDTDTLCTGVLYDHLCENTICTAQKY